MSCARPSRNSRRPKPSRRSTRTRPTVNSSRPRSSSAPNNTVQRAPSRSCGSARRAERLKQSTACVQAPFARRHELHRARSPRQGARGSTRFRPPAQLTQAARLGPLLWLCRAASTLEDTKMKDHHLKASRCRRVVRDGRASVRRRRVNRATLRCAVIAVRAYTPIT